MSSWITRARAASALALALTVVLGIAPFAAAQGFQTSTLSGTVSSSDGSVMPGVTVTLSSPVLQGERTTTSDANGNYIFRGLPGGTYTVTFALSGFGTVEREVGIALGTTPTVDTTLSVAAVTESVTVTAVAPSVLETTVVGANFKAESIDRLATGRTIQNIAELAPNLNDNTPNANQLQIAGAFAYDNVFLLNGVDINDNLFGTPHAVFVEDALDEVQVLTSGISAEYGRFSGGVINAVTKRGGNKLSGSFRTDLTNPDWQDESTFEKEQIALGRAQPHTDKLSKVFQATLGGPLIKDRLWFFAAGRSERSTISRNLTITGGSYDNEVKNDRIEVKLTGAVNPNHQISADYMRGPTDQVNNCSINCNLSIDAATLVTRNLPLDLFVANYNGVLSSNLFVEAQFSQKNFGFRGTGGTSTDILDSPFLALGRTGGIPNQSHYHAPYFSSLDPEDRNNRQYTAALSYFLSTSSLGRHDIKVGGEHYTSTRTGGNSQSSTGFVFRSDPKVVGGVVQRDANGNIIPVFVPGVSRLENWISVQGAQIDLTTLSLYVNDRWTLNEHLNFNVGLRYERHASNTTQAGIVTPESTAIVPRLGVTLDPTGDGTWVLQGSYGHYAGKSSETQFADNTNVGTPNNVTGEYRGPAGEGVNFAPGFDPANYVTISGNFPIRNVFLAEDLETPITREWTVQAGRRLGPRGEVKLSYTNRTVKNFLDDFISIDQGRTTVTEGGRTFGTFDNVVITNTDLPTREYQGLVLQSSYRITDNWRLSGAWTVQLKNEGSFEGEGGNTPGSYSIIGDRPEFYSAERHYPLGRVDDFQKHKVRVFSTYDLRLGGAGTVSLGALYRYDSPLTFSFAAANVPITAEQRAKNPGYANVPTTQTLFFGERGAGEFEEQHLLDLALNYDVPVWKSVRPYVKVDVRNVFNSQPLIGHNTTITADPNSPKDSLGLATGYTRGSLFGQGTSNAHYPIPREIRFAVGFRF